MRNPPASLGRPSRRAVSVKIAAPSRIHVENSIGSWIVEIDYLLNIAPYQISWK
jgi:hypothetical protein